MAQREHEEHLFSDDVYIISKNDGSKKCRFTNEDEAEAYYESLEREEVQDSIARNQAEAVAQNKEIIANQQKLIEAQEKKMRLIESQKAQMPLRFPLPQRTKQILDPEYKKWLQYQMETDPNYKRWEKEKEAEEARRKAEEAKRRAEQEAYAARLEAEKAEKERLLQIQIQQEKERQERKLQEEIHPIEDKMLRGIFVVNHLRIKVATNTKNQQVIDICKKSSNIEVLKALSRNASLNVADLNFVQKRIDKITDDEYKKKERERIKQVEQARREENFKTALKWIFGIIVAGVVIGLIIYFAKWIFGVIFVIALLTVIFKN